MGICVRWDEEDLRKLALAADDDDPTYIQREDGSWSVVGEDGWPVEVESLPAVTVTAIAAVDTEAIDAVPVSVVDTEFRETT